MKITKMCALLIVPFLLLQLRVTRAAGGQAGCEMAQVAGLAAIEAAPYFLPKSKHPYVLCLRGLFSRAIGVKAPGNLHRAANTGDLALVRKCIEYGANVNTPDEDGLSPLYLAAFGGYEGVARLLLDCGAKPHETNCSLESLYRPGRHSKGGGSYICNSSSSSPLVRETELHVASRHGHEAVVRLLLGSGWQVDALDAYHESPLYVAIRNRHEDIVRLLIAARANVNYCADKSVGVRSPLFFAVEIGFVPAVQELLRGGARVDWKSGVGMTPLQQAASSGHVEVVRLLLRAGANVNALDNGKRTALIHAVQGGHVGVVRELLAAETVDIDTADSFGLAALHWSLGVGDVDGGLEVVRALLDAGASVSSVIEPPSGTCGRSKNFNITNGSTPLHIAALRGNDVAVRLLLDRGAQTSVTDLYGCTPLLKAAEEGHASTVRVLLEANPAMIAAPDRDGKTPWAKALLGGHLPVVQLFLKRGSDVNAPLIHGYMPLHCAICSGSLPLVRFLLLNGADIHVLMGDGSVNPGYAPELLEWLECHFSSRDYAHDSLIKELVARGARLTAGVKNRIASERGQQLLSECEALAKVRLQSIREWLQNKGDLPRDLVNFTMSELISVGT